MITALTRRYLSEYTRRPINLVLLAMVPVVFVSLSAGAIADFARILGGSAAVSQLEAATAGWAAAFLAGVAGFFHVSGSRLPDRRLAAAGANTARVVAARMASSLSLAAVATVGALVALAIRTDVTDMNRAFWATVMFAVIYVAIGMTIGALVRSEVNGSLWIIFIWMFDVFLGPGMGPTESLVPRLFPTHFPTLVMLDASTTHGGPLGDVGASLLWVGAAIGIAALALVATTRPAIDPDSRSDANGLNRSLAGIRMAWREYRRNTALWVLLGGLPVFFITLSIAVTPSIPTPVELVERGSAVISILSMTEVHGAIMVPITVSFLAGLAGLFVVLGSADADRRLVLAGFRPREVMAARLGVVVAAALLVSVVSLVVTSISFQPSSWVWFSVATMLVAVTYALIGVLIGPAVGRIGGLYLMFLVPFLDAGLAQNVMFDAAPPDWAAWMPAHGAVRVLIDGAFTPTFDETGALLLAVLWLIGISAAAGVVFHRISAPRTLR